MKIDVTAPGAKIKKGNLHVLSKNLRDIEDIFTSFGFILYNGPEVENEFYNFDALNISKHHPARDMQDTFFLKNLSETVLRTHCTTVDIRYMEKHTPPFRVLATGRVFRNERTDATHEAQFHQWDGLLVGENYSLAHLKFLLSSVIRRFLNNETLQVRLRPGYFPFVEPGVELDVSCFKCLNGNNTSSCTICKDSGWIELLGAGMLHPNVLEAVNIDSQKYQGIAFGSGLERLVMLKYGIDDIRDFYDGNIPFLTQFS